MNMALVERIFAHLVFPLELFSSEPEVRAKEWHQNHPLNNANFWFAAIE